MSLCTVSGNIDTIFGAGVGGFSVVFQLVNFGNAVPMVPGSYLLVPAAFAIPIATDGSFSTMLDGNDTISPANTLYAVSYQTTAGAFGPYLYSFTGPSANLNSAIPVGTPSAPVFNSPLHLVIPTGSVNGVNVTFVLPTPTTAGQFVLVFAGGVLQNPIGTPNDYSISGATITFSSPPVVGPILAVY